MFRWYRDAAYCFVYLADVFKDGCVPENMSYRFGEGIIETTLPVLSEDVFRESRWFTRGWTLQELLAPLHSDGVRFYTSESLYLGDRTRLSNLISAVTGIPVEALAGGGLREYSISDRLEWARNRLTKREEDGAYSLLGLFDVHMPLIYGEGRENAMFRLLQECQANERRTLGFYRPLLRSLRRYLLASSSDYWSSWMLLYGIIFFAVFCAVIAQDHGPTLALYVGSKIMAIVRMQITRKMSGLSFKVMELSMSLVTRIMGLLAVVFFESSTIMLVVAGTYVLCSSILHALAKVAKSPHVSSELDEPQLRLEEPQLRRDRVRRLLVLLVIVFLDSPSIWRVIVGMCAIFAYVYHSERIPRWLQRW